MINGKHAERVIYGAYALFALVIVCMTVLASLGQEVPADLKQILTVLGTFLFAAQGIKPGVPASAVAEQIAKDEATAAAEQRKQTAVERGETVAQGVKQDE